MINATAILRVGTDPETRDAGGTPVVSFRGASDEKKKGEKVTTWVSCSFFGERAAKVAPFIRKGERIAVSGTISTREYEKRDGGTGFSLELRVNELELLGEKPHDGARDEPRPAASGGGGGGQRAPLYPDDSDIPFVSSAPNAWGL